MTHARSGQTSAKLPAQTACSTLTGMAERQQLGHRFERAAYKIKVKPYAGQPCGEVCQQRAAYAAYLLYAQGTAAQKPERQ